MIIKLPVSKRFFVTALLAGLAYGLLIIFFPYGILPHRTWGDFGLSAILFSALITLLGVVTGQVLKKTISNPYIVSIVALFYLHTVALLLVFTRATQYVSFLALIPIISLGLFYASNKFFNHSQLSKAKKYSFALIGFLISLVIGQVVGLYLLRLMMSMIMR